MGFLASTGYHVFVHGTHPLDSISDSELGRDEIFKKIFQALEI
jgi:hypothetical protein